MLNFVFTKFNRNILENRNIVLTVCFFSVNLGFESPGCGISDSVQSWMDQIQHNGDSRPYNVTENDDEEEVLIHFSNEDQVGPAYKYSQEGNTRRKRSLPNPSSK